MIMPPLETARLLIRPFVMSDLVGIHRILDVELAAAPIGSAGSVADRPQTLVRRAEWLRWSVMNYEQLARLFQPPYGDRAVVLKASGQLIGACGLVPLLAPFQQLPGFDGQSPAVYPAPFTPECGLYYAIAPAHQHRGYATEAAQALVIYAFGGLHLQRVLATTAHDNSASRGVMRKLGMRILENPHPEPPWMQVVGVLEAT